MATVLSPSKKLIRKVDPYTTIEYTIEDGPIPGGQALSYFVQARSMRGGVSGSAGEALFLKQFQEPTASSPDAENFLARQRLLLRRLQEIPEFVCVEKDVFVHDGIIYKVSERITGRTLADELNQAETDLTRLTAEVRRINARVLAYTVAAVHDKGIAHLDLNPNNVFMERKFIESAGKERLVIRLIDFDYARVDGAPPPKPTPGTPGYSSPEHSNPDRLGFPGKDSDVFALGIMLYEILARQYPYANDQDYLKRKAPYPTDLVSWIAPSVAELMWRAISPNRKERPTARQLHQALIIKREPIRVALVGAGRRIRFHRDMLLDRSQFRGIPSYEYLASSQARIFKDASGWVISQLQETPNPTYVGSARLKVGQRHPLREGDLIKIGRFEMRVEFEYE